MPKSDPWIRTCRSSSKKENPRGRRGIPVPSEHHNASVFARRLRGSRKYRAPKATCRAGMTIFWFLPAARGANTTAVELLDGTTEAELNAQQSKDKVWNAQPKPLAIRKHGRGAFGHPRRPASRSWAKTRTQKPGKGPAAGTPPPPHKNVARMEILEAKDNLSKPEVRKGVIRRSSRYSTPYERGDRSRKEQVAAGPVWPGPAQRAAATSGTDAAHSGKAVGHRPPREARAIEQPRQGRCQKGAPPLFRPRRALRFAGSWANCPFPSRSGKIRCPWTPAP